MSASNTPYNWSIHAIPAAYMLAFPPYLYQFARGMTASNYTATNIVPRTNLEALKSKLDSRTWQKLARARGVHLNALEGFPLFAAAMVRLLDHQAPKTCLLTCISQIAGNYAKLDVKEMNFLAADYLAARVVYSALYMTVKSEAASYLRSGAYAWSLSIPLYVLWKAGNRIAERV
jgi:uncharacterized MAPEG superfamily protein